MKKYQVGATILRLFLGFTFMIHGFVKFDGGISNTVGYFDSLGIPGSFAYVVAIIELVGGLAMILGLRTRIVAALFVVIMVGAVFTAKLSVGFVGGYELDLALLVIAVYLVLESKTLYSVDNKIFKDK